MTDWELMYDSRGDCAHVPELLDRVERDHDPAAWEELERRLTVGAPLAFPASLAALPRLVRLAGSSRRARRLAGRIVRYGAATDGCDELFEECTACVIELGRLLDEELRARPEHYLDPFRDLLAARQEYHWAAVLQDCADAAFGVGCPHCPVEVTMVIGTRGHYSTIRTEQLDDVERRTLRPASPEQLSGTGRWMYEVAVRDGRDALADTIVHLFGRVECPRCASVFTFADAYTAANNPRA
ncbi:hypothetical protein B6R96_32680 [Streptomyces sp. Sge12]|uniref:hypothetical protein n=1 Tax=Streptomyces sp. Sge12 TaxID=1972846 RepID=UPI0009C1D815|nr:hypothetical protein [Streptomyces sp. Sge12]ARE78120.1 hypothetical protein B6R96_32680 [Streptomyces sp. Sge12]